MERERRVGTGPDVVGNYLSAKLFSPPVRDIGDTPEERDDALAELYAFLDATTKVRAGRGSCCRCCQSLIHCRGRRKDGALLSPRWLVVPEWTPRRCLVMHCMSFRVRMKQRYSNTTRVRFSEIDNNHLAACMCR